MLVLTVSVILKSALQATSIDSAKADELRKL
jgi:hypothetical protein